MLCRRRTARENALGRSESASLHTEHRGVRKAGWGTAVQQNVRTLEGSSLGLSEIRAMKALSRGRTSALSDQGPLWLLCKDRAGDKALGSFPTWD